MLLLSAPGFTELYTLSLHDALPIYLMLGLQYLLNFASEVGAIDRRQCSDLRRRGEDAFLARSEKHTSELQSRRDLVCRLLLEKKKIRHTVQAYGQSKSAQICWPLGI